MSSNLSNQKLLNPKKLKKVLLPLVCMVLLYSCADDKTKDKEGSKAKEEINATKPSSETSTDEEMAIKKWLIGKEWKAENEAAPFSLLKVFSADSCSYASGKQHHWTFKNGEFENFGATWPLTKINDSTFSIYVKPTQKTYSYKLVGNL